MKNKCKKALTLLLILTLLISSFMKESTLTKANESESETMIHSDEEKESPALENEKNKDNLEDEENFKEESDYTETIGENKDFSLSEEDKSLIEKYKKISEENSNKTSNLDLKKVEEKLDIKNTGDINLGLLDLDLKNGYLGLDLNYKYNKDIKNLNLSLNNKIKLVEEYYDEDKINEIKDLLNQIDNILNSANNVKSNNADVTDLINKLKDIKANYSLKDNDLEIKEKNENQDKIAYTFKNENPLKKLTLLFKIDENILEDKEAKDYLIKLLLENQSNNDEISISNKIKKDKKQEEILENTEKNKTEKLNNEKETRAIFYNNENNSPLLNYGDNVDNSSISTDKAKLDVKVDKMIDYLGDGNINPDTNIQNDKKRKNDLKDIYRLYLKIKAEQLKKPEPIDLLFVLDASSSMNAEDMLIPNRYYPGYYNRVSRKDAVEHMLNNTDLIPTFLKRNSENRVAFLYFNDNEIPEFERFATRRMGYRYWHDAQLISRWSHRQSYISMGNIPPGMGTNYTAGLMRAEDLLRESEKSGRKQVMIFISDGVPTFYIDEDGNRQGNRSFEDIKNVRECMNGTLKFLEGFYQRHPNLITHAVGVSKDINASNPGSSQSPDVLKAMAKSSNKGKFLGVEKDTSELVELLKELMEGSVKEVEIEDILSDKVDFLKDRPDIKVIKKNTKTGEETVLFENNRFTYANGNYSIIQSIDYDDSDIKNKKVKLIFNPDYKLEEHTEYIMSYNVKTNANALKSYKENGYDYKGDKNTDYGNNESSSDKAGFRSNKNASVKYDKGRKYFPHPVVQVKDYELPETGGSGSSSFKIIGLILCSLWILAFFCERGKIEKN